MPFVGDDARGLFESADNVAAAADDDEEEDNACDEGIEVSLFLSVFGFTNARGDGRYFETNDCDPSAAISVTAFDAAVVVVVVVVIAVFVFAVDTDDADADDEKAGGRGVVGGRLGNSSTDGDGDGLPNSADELGVAVPLRLPPPLPQPTPYSPLPPI